MTNKFRLQRTIRKLRERLDYSRPLRVVIFPLPGQPPGPYFAEHDKRMRAVIDVWQAIRQIGIRTNITVLVTSGPTDSTGLSVAHYMEKQITTFATTRGYPEIADDIVIGEEESASTAQQIRFAKKDILKGEYDLVVVVSNTPHLWPAGSYFKHLIPEVRFVKWSSGSGNGCIGLPLRKFIMREIAHYIATMTKDRDGMMRHEATNRLATKWRTLRLPSIDHPE